MKEEKIRKLTALKDHFRSIPAKERESLSVCFLKVKLEVHSDQEFKSVKDFLGDFKISFTPENLDLLINYFHSKSNTLPAFLAMEDSITEIESSESKKIDRNILPSYDVDEVETIRDKIPHFKD